MDNITSDFVGLLLHDEKTLKVGFDGPKYDNEKKFFDDIPKLFKGCKFVILKIFEYESTEYSSNMEFCNAIKEKLDALHVPYFFMNTENFIESIALISGNVTVKFQDIVLFVSVHGESIAVRELEYTENGYKKLGNKLIKFNQNESHQIIREKVLGSTNFKRILLFTQTGEILTTKLFKTILRSKKLISLDRLDVDKFGIEMAKWFFDRSYTKFYVIPTSARMCTLFIGLNHEMYELIAVNDETTLPFKKTITLPKFFRNNVFMSYKERSEPVIQHFPIDSDCHKFKLSLTVDIESNQLIGSGGIGMSCFEKFPEALDEQMTKKIPVIGFYDYSSVICVHKDSEYVYLDSWNSWFGKELVIGFDKEKPSFCDDDELLLKKPTYAVYDLIKVMSMPPDNIQTDKLWTFSVTKDANHPVLLEFDSYDGTKKAASPAFLMAMLIKHHLKVIKKDTGEKPAEIGIRLFYDFNEDEKARVEAGLKEACELLKIGCDFV